MVAATSLGVRGVVHGVLAPASRPKIVIAVVVNRPSGSHWGATVAAPVFQEIGEKTLWYLRVPSDAPTKHELKEQQQQSDGKRVA